MDIVKIGGSLLTNKSRYRSFQSAKTDEILKNVINLDNFVLVHGGGSFGHFISKKFGLPGSSTKERMMAASIVKRDMAELNQKIVTKLQKLKLNPIGISPFFLGQPEHMDMSIITNSIREGFLPVIYGDISISNSFIDIVSGDTIMMTLARELKPKRAIFITDVDGVFTKDPKRSKHAKLIEKYGGEKVEFGSVKKDVTGGMNLKFKAMITCKKYGAKTYLMNGNHPDRLNEIGKSGFKGTEFV